MSEIENLRFEIGVRDRQIAELQESMSKLVNSQLSQRVRAFQLKYGHPVNWTPAVPDNATMRVRLKLIAEEFVELLRACACNPGSVDFAECELHFAIDCDVDDMNLPAAIDALADLSYVIEGTAATLGVNMHPIMEEVHRANMAKEPAEGKPTKPAGWVPPDIEGELVKQGWIKK